MCRYIVFNDESCQGVELISDAYCTIIFDIQRLTRLRVLPLPVAALSAGGEYGLHISFERQNHAMPGKNSDALSRASLPAGHMCVSN